MNDLVAAVIILLVVVVAIKLLFPTKLPDYAICAKDNCWSTRSIGNRSVKPVENKVIPATKPTTTQTVKEGMHDDLHDNEGVMLEVFTSPKDFQDTRAMLKNIADEPEDLTLNYQAKYSK